MTIKFERFVYDANGNLGKETAYAIRRPEGGLVGPTFTDDEKADKWAKEYYK